MEPNGQPATESRGDRTPPPRTPPTAVGAATPPPPRPSPVAPVPSFPHRHPALRHSTLLDAFRATVNGVLDVADAAVERLEAAARR